MDMLDLVRTEASDNPYNKKYEYRAQCRGRKDGIDMHRGNADAPVTIAAKAVLRLMNINAGKNNDK